MFTATIPAKNLTNLIEKINSMAKKAEKLGLEKPSVTVGGTIYREVRSETTGIRYQKAFVEVTVSGEKPVVNGWDFVAKLTPIADGQNLVSVLPGVVSIPETFRTAPMDCGHCNLSRRRNEVFVLQSGSEYIQVGRSCLGDFFPGYSAESLAKRAEFEIELREASEESYGGSDSTVFDVVEFLAVTSAVIREEGWVSRSAAYNDPSLGEATATIAQGICSSAFGFEKYREDHPLFIVDQRDEVLARVAVEWAKNLDDNQIEGNDYLYNLKLSASQTTGNKKTAGTLASLIPAHQKAAQEKIEKAKKPISAFVSKVGEKISAKVTCSNVITTEGFYGVTFINRFIDESGNVIVWMTGSFEGEQGKEYLVSGKVKSQENFRGENQTQLTRCKVS